MTEAKDFRLGNYVYGAMNEICVVELIGDILNPNVVGYREVGNFNSYGQNGQKPIPLDENILLKLGFEKDDNGTEIFDINYEEWYMKEFPVIGNIVQSYDKTFLFDENTDTLRIKYVHELQNLYFALNGKELEVTL